MQSEKYLKPFNTFLQATDVTVHCMHNSGFFSSEITQDHTGFLPLLQETDVKM